MFVSYSFKLQNSRQTLTNTIGRERREDAVGCHDNHGGDEARDGHSERHGTDTFLRGTVLCYFSNYSI